MQLLDLFIEEHFMTLEQTCEMLSISTATGKNWIKSGKLKPVSEKGKDQLFMSSEVKSLLLDIKGGQDNKLKSRRNKKHVSGSYIPVDYIQDKSGIVLVQKIVNLLDDIEAPFGYDNVILAEYALKLLNSRNMIQMDNKSILLMDYLDDRSNAGIYSKLVADLIDNVNDIYAVVEELGAILHEEIAYIDGQDILGLLYMSLQCIGSRKSNGVYYTPYNLVQDSINSLLEKIEISEKTTVIDPCCGTGNFLMNMYSHLGSVDKIFGSDIDPISIYLTRLNMAIVSRTKDVSKILNNFVCGDSLTNTNLQRYDIVIGNPPWGYDFNAQEDSILRALYISANSKTIESFCVFLEQAFNITSENGLVCFVIPESMLNVKIHQSIREYLFKMSRILRVHFWGNIFKGVQCPAITLILQNSPGSFTTQGMEIFSLERKFEIRTSRVLDITNWFFDISDDEFELIKKIESVPHYTMKDRADFALGIVTGNNSEFIMNEKVEGTEMILKGSDVYKFKFGTPDNYIDFKPEKFQQVAPISIYRSQEKILYRFICSSLVFAYDNQQTLSINSCNVVVPNIPGLPIKYITAILNSRVIQYYFDHKFRSVKILRSHIESLPIPKSDPVTINKIEELVDSIMLEKSSLTVTSIYDNLDGIIMSIFNINDDESNLIVDEINKKNIFLF